LAQSSPISAQHNQVADSVVTDNNTNNNLELEFGKAECISKTEEQGNHRELTEDCPSFDLGFNVQGPEKTACSNQDVEAPSTMEEPYVVSSNEESGDSLDNFFASIEMPPSKREMRHNKAKFLQRSQAVACHATEEKAC
jgi:hypothetical protein